MTVVVSNVQRARIIQESTFATDATASMASWLDLPFVEGTMNVQLLEPLETPLITQQHIDAYPNKVHMPKRARAAFDINLAGLGLATGLRTQGPLGMLLKVALGGEVLGTGTTVNDAGATTTVVILTSAAGLTAGGAVAFATGTGGRLEMREIKTISSNTITLKHALTSAPANGSTCYAAAMYYPSTELSSGYSYSLQLLVEGIETDDRFLLLGGQIASPPRFTVANGQIARMSFEWEFANWFYADGVNTSGDFVGPALANATYVYSVPLVVKDSEYRVFDVGTTSISNTLMGAPSYEFATSIAYTPHLAPGGTQNILGWVRLRTAPLTSGSFTIPYEAETWRTEKAEDDRRAVALQIGSSPTLATGGGALLVHTNVQITDVQMTDIGGIKGQVVSYEGSIEADLSVSSTDWHTAAMRIHLF